MVTATSGGEGEEGGGREGWIGSERGRCGGDMSFVSTSLFEMRWREGGIGIGDIGGGSRGMKNQK